MSKIILGWQLKRPLDDIRVHQLTEQISQRYQPLFLERLQCVGLWQGNQGLLHFDVPHGADAGLDRTGDRICCVTGRPTAAGEDSGRAPAPFAAGALYNRLVTSTTTVQADVIREINPPFTLCWFDQRSSCLGVIHDGLGQDQFFVSHTAEGIVFSNRCWPILRALGAAPQIDAEAWKYWFCMGWFPGTSTPLRNIRFLDSGEIIVGNSDRISSSTSNALSWWIHQGDHQDTAALMVQAADAFREVVRQNKPPISRFEADLTGGIDSRAICSLLMKEAFPCRYFTGGAKFSPDVVLASRIARQFGLDWTHVKDPRFTQGIDLRGVVDTQFRHMTLWGEGLVEPTRFAHFQGEPAPTRQDAYLGGGSSEISKGHYYRGLLRLNPGASFHVDRSLQNFTQPAAELLGSSDASKLSQLIRHQLDQGATCGARGWAILDHFYLRERTRRWQSAHLAINLFEVDILPFNNAQHITLAFAMRPGDKANSAFQRFIIQRNEEALLRIPLSGEVARHPYFRLLRLIPRVRWLSGALKTMSWADYFRDRGKTSVDWALSRESPLFDILDRSKLMKKWNDFLRGTTQDPHFPLGLLAFSYWHLMVVEETAG
jgi:Asparagine synthase